MIYILVAAACFLLWLFPGVRCALTHPFHCIYYGVKDGYNYIRYKQGNLRKTGNLDIFCGYFGNGKTLSLVKQVVCREYKRYDGLTVWCNRRQKFVTQRILILSNVDLCVPYERLTGLAQVCAISKANEIYDDEHDTLTITIVCMDELCGSLSLRNTLKSRTLGERRAQFIKARGLETQHLQSGGLAYMAPQTYPI